MFDTAGNFSVARCPLFSSTTLLTGRRLVLPGLKSTFWGGAGGLFAYQRATPHVEAVPVPLAISRFENKAALTWTNAAFALQAAPDVSGTFTNLPGATGSYTSIISGPGLLFRLELWWPQDGETHSGHRFGMVPSVRPASDFDWRRTTTITRELSVLSRFAPQQVQHFLVRSLGKSFIIAANRVEVRVHQECPHLVCNSREAVNGVG